VRQTYLVPVRESQAGTLALRTGRLPTGERVGLAFTCEASLLLTMGPFQHWIRLAAGPAAPRGRCPAPRRTAQGQAPLHAPAAPTRAPARLPRRTHRGPHPQLSPAARLQPPASVLTWLGP
jgi:hypothetical protein